jgi:hypothetical protein
MVGRKTVGTILAVISIIVVILAYTYNSYRAKRELSPVIETKLGKVQGTTLISRSGREFYEFLGNFYIFIYFNVVYSHYEMLQDYLMLNHQSKNSVLRFLIFLIFSYFTKTSIYFIMNMLASSTRKKLGTRNSGCKFIWIRMCTIETSCGDLWRGRRLYVMKYLISH